MEALRKKVLSRIEVITETGCWIWMRHLRTSGNPYGSLYYNGRMGMAHRASYEAFVGPIGDRDVLHTCDIPECVNPKHLVLGSHRENMHDAINKGRKKGLTLKEREEVISLWPGVRQADIAKKYGVSQPAISKIICLSRHA